MPIVRAYSAGSVFPAARSFFYTADSSEEDDDARARHYVHPFGHRNFIAKTYSAFRSDDDDDDDDVAFRYFAQPTLRRQFVGRTYTVADSDEYDDDDDVIFRYFSKPAIATVGQHHQNVALQTYTAPAAVPSVGSVAIHGIPRNVFHTSPVPQPSVHTVVQPTVYSVVRPSVYTVPRPAMYTVPQPTLVHIVARPAVHPPTSFYSSTPTFYKGPLVQKSYYSYDHSFEFDD